MVRWKQKVKSLKENSQGFNKKRHNRRGHQVAPHRDGSPKYLW